MRKYLVKGVFAILRLFAIPRDWLYCCLKGVVYDVSFRFRGVPLIQRRHGSEICIGKYFTACSRARWNSIGVFQPVMLKTVSSGARLIVGHHVGMSGCTVSASRFIQIGDHVLIGSGALLTDSDAHPLAWVDRMNDRPCRSAPIVVEDHVFVGARAIVLKGVRLGRGCVVGAGAVVTGNVPANAVVAGNPARVVKMLDDKK